MSREDLSKIGKDKRVYWTIILVDFGLTAVCNNREKRVISDGCFNNNDYCYCRSLAGKVHTSARSYVIIIVA